MGLHSTFLASPSSSYGDQDHDDAENNDFYAHIDDGDAHFWPGLILIPHMVIRMRAVVVMIMQRTTQC